MFAVCRESVKLSTSAEASVIDKHVYLITLLCDCHMDLRGCFWITEISNKNLNVYLELLFDRGSQAFELVARTCNQDETCPFGGQGFSKGFPDPR